MKNNLIKIDQNKIKNSNFGKKNKSPFLTLALIRNDISDLIHLQHLFVVKNKKIKMRYSAKTGQFAGRIIYIMRIALSHYYEFLRFLNEKNNEINSDKELNIIIKSLSEKEISIWKKFNLLASKIGLSRNNKKNNNDIDSKIVILSECVRGDLTFHYYNSSHFLYRGFNQAFIIDKKEQKNKYPLATELIDLNKDRSYYIDLSIQRYLETESNLNEDLFSFELKIIDTLAEVNLILNRILNKYHNDIKYKK